MNEEPADLVQYKTDHDLLIALNVHMENLRTDLRDLKDGNAKRLDNVEGSVSDLDRENSYTKGMIYALTGFVGLIIVPAVGWLFTDYIQFKTSNDSHIVKVITTTVSASAIINHQ